MLKNFVAVYIPGTQGLSKPITKKQHAARALDAAAKLSALFGGATLYETTGTYLADNGELVTERVIVVKSFHDADPAAAAAQIALVAKEVKTLYDQESVAYETEQGIDFC